MLMHTGNSHAYVKKTCLYRNLRIDIFMRESVDLLYIALHTISIYRHTHTHTRSLVTSSYSVTSSSSSAAGMT